MNRSLIPFLLTMFSVFMLFEISFFWTAIRYFKVQKSLYIPLILYTVFTYLFLIYNILTFDRSIGVKHSFYWALGFLLLHWVPKFITILFWATGALAIKIPQLFSDTSNLEVLESRRSFVGKLGLLVATIPFSGIVYGMWKGRYAFKVFLHQLSFDELPKAFDGLKILQISDIHSGSLTNISEIEKAIALINAQDFDLFLFTGDIVNSKADEFSPWVSVFNKIKTPRFGKFSVLGNHDYGEYLDWNSEQEKQANFKAIQDLHEKVGFKLLNNAHEVIHKDGERLSVVGVENWGAKFKKLGDLDAASKGLSPTDFKVLMSHDPSHWEYQIKDHPMNFQLTLSGHTHGMQFGIEIPGFIQWSPIKYVYKLSLIHI